MMHRHSLLSPRGLAALGALTALFTVAPRPGTAQDAAQGTYLWTFDHKQGEIEKFRTHIRISGKKPDGSGDITFVLDSVSRQETHEVTAEGAATYDQLDEKLDAVIDGKAVTVKLAEVKPITITVGKNGQVLKRVNPNDTNRADKALSVLQSLPAPTQPVKIGESWKTDIPNTLLHNKIVSVTQTLVGVEKVLGQDALKIRLQLELPTSLYPSPDDIVKLQETYYLDLKTHHLLRAVYSVQNTLMPFPASKYLSRVVVTRIVPGVNDQQEVDIEKLLSADPQTL